MTVEFKQETMETAMKCALIIDQQTEIFNEAIGELAADFGVSKSIAKKIVTAFAKDKLEKTGEKMEDERSALANADMMIEAVENMSFDAEDLLEETAGNTED